MKRILLITLLAIMLCSILLTGCAVNEKVTLAEKVKDFPLPTLRITTPVNVDGLSGMTNAELMSNIDYYHSKLNDAADSQHLTARYSAYVNIYQNQIMINQWARQYGSPYRDDKRDDN